MASWSKRFAEQRIAGLYSRHISQVATVLTPELEARILEYTRDAPSSSTHWTTRKLAAHLDVSHMMVARVWRKHGVDFSSLCPILQQFMGVSRKWWV